MSDITQITGVGLGAMAIILFYKLSARQIKNNTDALNILAQLVRELKELILLKK